MNKIPLKRRNNLFIIFFLIVIAPGLLLTLCNFGLNNPKTNKFQNEVDSNFKEPLTSDTTYLPPSQHAYKSGYCSNAGSISISWSTSPSTSIEVRAMLSSQYSLFSLTGNPYGQLLSTASSGSENFNPTVSDTWYIVFWNRYGSHTWVTYDVTFNPGVPKSISITQPTSSSSYETGTTQTILWTSEGSISSVKIEMYKASSLFSTIYSSTTNDGNQGWTIPYSCTTASDYRIKITDISASSVYDFSDYFSITYVAPKSLSLSQPNSGSVYNAGTVQTLIWTSTGAISNIIIELYKGTTLFSSLNPSTLNDGTESWTVPLSCSTGMDYRIKITDTSDSNIYDYSDYFKIYAAGEKSLNVINPSSSSLFIAGTNHNLIWNSTGPINDVEIQLFKDDVFNLTIYSSIFNDGNEMWLVPLSCTTATNYKMKIIDISNSSVYAFSEYFTIETPKTITINEPSISSIYNINFSCNIIWNSTGDIDNVSIELFQGEVFHTSIRLNTPNDGIEEWIVPITCSPGLDYRIKITFILNSSVYDFSDYFSLEILKTISIIAPSFNSAYRVGTVCEITWNTTGDMLYVDIGLFQNSNLILSLVNSKDNNQSFIWIIPDSFLSGNNYSIRISDTNDSNIFAFSSFFTITVPPPVPKPDYTILIIIVSITIAIVLGSFIALRQRKKVKIKKEKIITVQDKVMEYFRNSEILVEKMKFENAILELNECLTFVQKEGIKKYNPEINANIQAVKIRHIKSQILDLGAKYNQIYISEIVEKTKIDDELLIAEVINEMVANSEIYAEFSKDNQTILFDLETNIKEIDALMETFKKWEQEDYGKKIG